MSATVQGGRSLAWWLSTQMPTVYKAVARSAALSQSVGSVLARADQGATLVAALGSLGECRACRRNRRRVRLTQLSDLGDDYATYTDDADSSSGTSYDGGVSNSAFSDATTTYDLASLVPATLEPATVSATDVPTPSVSTPTVDGASGSSGQSSSALSAVGQYLTSPQGLNAVIGLGTQVLKTAAAADQASAAQSMLQAQVARVSAGGLPAAVSYQVNPATGALTPVLTTPSGQVPLTSALASATGLLAGGGIQLTNFLQEYGVIIGLALLALYALRR
jgi:hypothetical protein